MVSQAAPGEPDVVPVKLLVFLQMRLVLVDCSGTECLGLESPLCCTWM